MSVGVIEKGRGGRPTEFEVAESSVDVDPLTKYFELCIFLCLVFRFVPFIILRFSVQDCNGFGIELLRVLPPLVLHHFIALLLEVLNDF